MDSLRFASKDHVKGVYIVFDGKAIVGTRARKIRSKSYSAFESINYPVVAFIDEARILQYVETEREPHAPIFYNRLNPKVFVLKLIPGIEPDILEYISEHYDAIIIESYGVGGIPFHDNRNFFDKLENITKKLEGSDAGVYEVGFKAINQYNVLQAYDMTVESASVKLMWILGKTKNFEEVKERFYKKINYDILIPE